MTSFGSGEQDFAGTFTIVGEGVYHVTIEPRKAGGWLVAVKGPRIALVDTAVVDTVEEGREYARKAVEWARTKPDTISYDI